MPAKSVLRIPQRSLRILSLAKRRCSVVHYKQEWSFSRSPQNLERSQRDACSQDIEQELFPPNRFYMTYSFLRNL